MAIPKTYHGQRTGFFRVSGRVPGNILQFSGFWNPSRAHSRSKIANHLALVSEIDFDQVLQESDFSKKLKKNLYWLVLFGNARQDKI